MTYYLHFRSVSAYLLLICCYALLIMPTMPRLCLCSFVSLPSLVAWRNSAAGMARGAQPQGRLGAAAAAGAGVAGGGQTWLAGEKAGSVNQRAWRR
jgi:hypothetical protein